MITRFLVCFALGVLPLHSAPDEEWVSLFDGFTFDGWHMPDGFANIAEQDFFTIKDGEIHVYEGREGGSTQTFTGIITDQSYANYHLSLEYKWGENKFAPRNDAPRDSGVCFHMSGADKIWPTSVEMQIQEGDTGDAWVIRTQASSTVSRASRDYNPEGEEATRGGKDEPFGRFRRRYFYEVPGWNRIEIICRGDRATFLVNGEVTNEVFDMKQPDLNTGEYVPLKEGRILLQGEGAEVAFRDIKIKLLDK